MKRLLVIYAGIQIVLLLSLSAYSMPVAVEDVQAPLLDTDWFYGDTDTFQTDYAGIPGLDTYLRTTTFRSEKASERGVTADYVVYAYDGTFSFTPSVVTDQTDPGGLAKGEVAAGGILTINGNMYRNFGDGALVASGDLIVAQVTAEWLLEEQSTDVYPENTVRGRAFYDIIGGALYDANNLDDLLLGDFTGIFTLERCNEITDFLTSEIYTCTNPKFQATPEPSALLLLGVGGLVLRKRRR